MVKECFIILRYGEMRIFIHTHTLQENDVWKPGSAKNFSVLYGGPWYGGQAKRRGKDPATRQGICMQLRFSRGDC